MTRRAISKGLATTVLPYGSVDVVALIGLFRNTVPSVNMAAVQDLLYDHPDLSCTEPRLVGAASWPSASPDIS